MHRMRTLFLGAALLLATTFAATAAPLTSDRHDGPQAAVLTDAPDMLAGDLAMPAITTTCQTAQVPVSTQVALQSFDVAFATNHLERVPEVAWRPAHATPALSAAVLGRHRM